MSNQVLLKNGGYNQFTKTSPSLEYLALQALSQQINTQLESSEADLMVLIDTYNKFIDDKFPEDTHLKVNVDNLKDIDIEQIISKWKDNRDSKDMYLSLIERIKKLEVDIAELEAGQ